MAFAVTDVEASKYTLPGDKQAYFGYVPASAYDKSNHDANKLAEYMSDKKQQAYIFHGDSSLSVGDTLYNAFDAVESLEHYCRVSILARSIVALEGATPGAADNCADKPCTCGKHPGGACDCGKSAAPASDCDVQEVVRRVMMALGN